LYNLVKNFPFSSTSLKDEHSLFYIFLVKFGRRSGSGYGILMGIRMQELQLMRIRIHHLKLMRIYADPDPKPWEKLPHLTVFVYTVPMFTAVAIHINGDKMCKDLLER